MNVALIGMRGAGKSNVARRVGFQTKMPALSTDVLVNYESGLSTEEFVAERGWPAFRELEYEVLRKAVALEGLVIDCGGGILVDLDEHGNEVFSDRKAKLLVEHTSIVWLRGDVTLLAAKVDGKQDRNRPTLSRQESTEQMMRRREPFFERVAEHTIRIDGRRRADIANQVVRTLGLTRQK